MMRVLVVEDDALLGDAIQAGLKQSGYAVDWMKDGVSAEQALATEPYAAVVLDLGLPRLSGLEVLRRLRGRNIPIPVLILTAMDTVDDRIRGLDPAAHCVLYRDKQVELSAREFALLHALMLNAGKVLSRAQLEEQLYAWGDEIESNAVEVHIHHLRRKLFPELIETIRGVGYLMQRDKAT